MSNQLQRPDDLARIIPLAEAALQNYNKRLEAEDKQNVRDFELTKTEIDVSLQKFKLLYILLVVIVLFVLSIAAWLIIAEHNVQAGLLVVSHVVAIGLGIISGMGMKRMWHNGNDHE